MSTGNVEISESVICEKFLISNTVKISSIKATFPYSNLRKMKFLLAVISSLVLGLNAYSFLNSEDEKTIGFISDNRLPPKEEKLQALKGIFGPVFEQFGVKSSLCFRFMWLTSA